MMNLLIALVLVILIGVGTLVFAPSLTESIYQTLSDARNAISAVILILAFATLLRQGLWITTLAAIGIGVFAVWFIQLEDIYSPID